MSRAIPPLPQYVFTAWCLVKHRDSFYLFLLVCKLLNDAVSTYRLFRVEGNDRLMTLAYFKVTLCIPENAKHRGKDMRFHNQNRTPNTRILDTRNFWANRCLFSVVLSSANLIKTIGWLRMASLVVVVVLKLQLPVLGKPQESSVSLCGHLPDIRDLSRMWESGSPAHTNCGVRK
jgi:hypothetical protein